MLVRTAILAASLVCVSQPACAQTAESLLEEALTYNDEAFEAFKSANEYMGNNNYAVQACEDAHTAVVKGIKARNRLIQAKRLTSDADERAKLSGAIYQATESLNGYKTLYNEHCGNEPYPMTEH